MVNDQQYILRDNNTTEPVASESYTSSKVVLVAFTSTVLSKRDTRYVPSYLSRKDNRAPPTLVHTVHKEVLSQEILELSLQSKVQASTSECLKSRVPEALFPLT